MSTSRSSAEHGLHLALRCALACLALVPFLCWAHGGVSWEKDVCRLTIGPYSMHFTGYQPEASAAKEFCQDISNTGRTIIVLDSVDPELRQLPIGVRIVRDTGDSGSAEAPVVFQLPASVYPSGSLSFEHVFHEHGRFVGIVTAGANHEYESRFPFSVGAPGLSGLVWGLLALGGIAAATGLYFFMRRPRQPDALGRPSDA